MTLQTYRTLLRPGRTAAAAVILGFFAFGLLIPQCATRPTEFAFATWCILLPLLAGVLLIAPLHEVAHRSSFPLLPGADRQLFRSHLLAFSVAALLLCGFASLFVSAVPAPAAFGLILTGLSLPLLDSKQGKAIGHNSVFGLVTAGGFVLAVFTRNEITAFACTAPWLLFAGGIAVSIACFRVGFARGRLRARSSHPNYFAPQSTLLFVGTDILQHAQAENSRLAEQRSARRGADWSAGIFHDTLRDWLRIINHARFGQTRWARTESCVLVATCVGIIAGALVAGSMFASLDGQRWKDYCRLVVEAARASGEIAQSDVRLFFILIPQVAFPTVLMSVIMAAVPARPFPLSRVRLADALFIAFVRRVLFAIAGCAAGAGVVMATAALAANQPWSAGLFGRFLPLPALALLAAALIPPVVFSPHVGARVAFGLLGFPAYIITSFFIILRHAGPSATLLWTAILSTLALGAIAYTRFTFRRHYRTCDLNRTGDALRRLGFRIA